jgi:hypothetical protein
VTLSSQVVDTTAARAFMTEVLERVTAEELTRISGELGAKADHVRALVLPGASGLAREELRRLLRSSFATRRHADAILDDLGPDAVGAGIDALLHEDEDLATRLDQFASMLGDFGSAPEIGFELLHLCRPERYWLWTRWMWDPRTETGALPLVTAEGFDLFGADRVATYHLVGRALAFVDETGRAVGFTDLGGVFGIDVYLASVYCIYLYTVLRLRMTNEFNRIVPELPELVRRLLGVHHLEV